MSTWPDESYISKLANEIIVEKKLCACISFNKIRSLYYWENKLENQEEILTLFKTTKNKASKLILWIKKNHPYEVPEILRIDIDQTDKNYLNWLVKSTTTI